jgi:hypothetical protein
MKFTPVKYNDDEFPKMIISKYNGRVNVIEPSDPDVPFRLFERMAVSDKIAGYRDALVGESEWNTIADGYFSAANIQSIQDALKSGVYRVSGGKFVIAPQNVDFLKVFMRNIYLQNVEYNARESPEIQIQQLNQLVLEQLIPKLHAESIGYFKYLQDQSSLVVPLDLPQPVDRDYRPLEYKIW